MYVLQNVNYLLEYYVKVNIKLQSKVYSIGMRTSTLSLVAILVESSTRVVRFHQLDLIKEEAGDSRLSLAKSREICC